ncbi:MAG: YcxB family protein [Chitinophagaceae bacterium]|nr:YcxB family protein [Chitinophagaceae bacterium]MCW5905510.1 YcxB family protein [Chitinophagaceae bacterium]
MQFGFVYDKKKTIQALRYHFISRSEIKMLIIVVNVFAIISAILFYFKKIRPEYFLLGSILWLLIMIATWFILPYVVYKKTAMFQQRFIATIQSDKLVLETEAGNAEWQWNRFQRYTESPNFFHLYFNPKSFLLIPNDDIGDEMRHDIRGILKNGIS